MQSASFLNIEHFNCQSEGVSLTNVLEILMKTYNINSGYFNSKNSAFKCQHLGHSDGNVTQLDVQLLIQ